MRTAVLSMMVALLGMAGRGFAGADNATEGGCGGPVPKSGTYSLRHDNLRRVYGLRLPANYDGRQPVRLLLAFHSWGGDEREFTQEPIVLAETSRRGYILAAPRGLGSGVPDHRRNGWTFRGSSTGVVEEGDERKAICDVALSPDYRYPSCRQGVAVNACAWTQCQDDDVAFVTALVAHLEKTLCVDEHHVYAAGGFNGGMFIWELGQNPKSAPLFRAIASIIGIPHRGDLRGPGRHDPLPALLITGRADTEVPPGEWDEAGFTTSSNQTERVYYTGATAISRRWAEALACPSAGKEQPFDTGYPEANCRTYCPVSGRDLPPQLDCRPSMGHEYGFDWSWKLVLDFFDRH